MTGRDKNKITFCALKNEEASVMLARDKIGRNDQRSWNCCQDVMSLYYETAKVSHDYLFVTLGSVSVLHTIFVE